LAAEAAGAQNNFWCMHDLLFENQLHLDAPHLRGYAAKLGLDLRRYDADIGNRVYFQRVQEHVQSGIRSRVRVTPTFFVNGFVQDVSFGLEKLQTAIEQHCASESTDATP
jgi:protein-disulfide isomerase